MEPTYYTGGGTGRTTSKVVVPELYTGNDFKRCYTCKRVLPRTNDFFNRNKKRKDGLHDECKECDMIMVAMRRKRKTSLNNCN